MSKIKATGYYVLIETEEVTLKSDGGIIMASAKDEKRLEEAQCIGTVVDIGPRAFKGLQCGCNSAEEWGVKIGDKVEFATYDGKRPVSAGKDTKYRLITDQKIIAVVTNE
jgi:co-chaperonin GroES (HSP10)